MAAAVATACWTFGVESERLTWPAIVVRERVLVRRRRQVDVPGLTSEGPEVLNGTGGVCGGGGGGGGGY
jgi:hypothetical protein